MIKQIKAIIKAIYYDIKDIILDRTNFMWKYVYLMEGKNKFDKSQTGITRITTVLFIMALFLFPTYGELTEIIVHREPILIGVIAIYVVMAGFTFLITFVSAAVIYFAMSSIVEYCSNAIKKYGDE